MPIAADYPFLDVLWTIIVFFAWVAWFWILIVILGDVFRREDIGGWAKAAWVVFLIVLPFVGVLAYMISQHDQMNERRAHDVKRQQTMIDDHIRSVAGGGSGGGSGRGPAGEIADAKRLLDQGAITDAEFQKIKQTALA